MGKIRTEGVGEVQEFIDIVSDIPVCQDVVVMSCSVIMQLAYPE